MTTVDIQHAAAFLKALDPIATTWTFQTFNDGIGKRGDLARTKHGTFEDLAPWLVEMNAQGAGVFVTVNETDGSGRRTAANIRRVRALVADFDKPNPGTPERLRSNKMPPSIIVESSPGRFHAYWLVDDVQLAEFKALQQAIARHWGSDKNVCDLPRVLRLPGFMHCKGEPQPVRMLEATGRRYGRELIHFYQSYTPAVEMGESATEGSLDTPENVLGAYAATALKNACQTVAGALVGERNMTLNAQALGIGQLVAGGEIPKAQAWGALRIAAEETGLECTEIDATLRSAFKAGAKAPRTAPTVDASLLDDLDDEPDPLANLVPVSLSDLMTAPLKPVRFIFKPLFPRGHATLLSAHGGTGKSSLAIALCAHVACGRSWAGLPAIHGRSLLVSLEDDRNVCRGRLRAVVEAYGLDPWAVAQSMMILDGTGGETALMTDRSGKIALTNTLRELREAAQGFDLIMIDNASDAFNANENDRSSVRIFLNLLTKIARNNDAAVGLLAHVDKVTAREGGRGNSYSGSTAWHNSARSRLAMVADEATGTVTLTQEKLNHGVMTEPLLLAFKAIRFIADDDASYPVLMPLELIDAQDTLIGVRNGQAAKDAQAVYDLLVLARRDSIAVPTASRGASTAWHALEPFPEMARMWRNKEGKRRFNAAMLHLQREGRIEKVAYRTAHRHWVERWELTKGGHNWRR